jgi:hypothetical protein
MLNGPRTFSTGLVFNPVPTCIASPCARILPTDRRRALLGNSVYDAPAGPAQTIEAAASYATGPEGLDAADGSDAVSSIRHDGDERAAARRRGRDLGAEFHESAGVDERRDP